MAQTISLYDETQLCDIVLTENYPVLYSNDKTLRTALLKIGDLHTAEPIDTVNFNNTSDVFTLTVTLVDARVALFTFESVDPQYSEFTIDFTGGAWEETSLDLLIILKNAILKLNEGFPLSDGDSFDWASV